MANRREMFPLPRRAPKSPYISRFLRALIDNVSINGAKDKLKEIAQHVGDQKCEIRRLVYCEKVPEPPKARKIAWELHDKCQLRWMSPMLLLDVEPLYRGHVIGLVGEVLRHGDDAQIRRWWKALQAYATAHFIPHNPKLLPAARKERSGPFAFTRKQYPAQSRSWRVVVAHVSRISPEELASILGLKCKYNGRDAEHSDLCKAIRDAWGTWWGKEKTAGFPDPVAALIGAHRARLDAYTVALLEDTLAAWFERGPEQFLKWRKSDGIDRLAAGHEEYLSSRAARASTTHRR
ncbi:MAG TPA: hypothetical protein VFO29_11815 [Candidatus Rubrimentiphilum sp.]|nr:hypothetical protein [Candidatus Rubrimentiphilum sp.]